MLDLGAAAERILGPTLAAEGLTIDGYSPSSITFRDERRVIELSYYREDLTPWLHVELGLRGSSGQLTVALWRLFPEVEALAARETCEFDSAELLEARLVEIRDDWLGRLIWPVFEKPERFRAGWLAQQAESEKRYEADVRRERLVQARWAYDHDNLARAVEQYTLAGLDDLTAADRRRYTMARRGLTSRARD